MCRVFSWSKVIDPPPPPSPPLPSLQTSTVQCRPIVVPVKAGQDGIKLRSVFYRQDNFIISPGLAPQTGLSPPSHVFASRGPGMGSVNLPGDAHLGSQSVITPSPSFGQAGLGSNPNPAQPLSPPTTRTNSSNGSAPPFYTQ